MNVQDFFNQEKVIELRFNYENELNNRSVEITGID